jgi:hypothetical protein
VRIWLTASATATLAVLALMVGFTAAGAPAGDTVVAELAHLRDDPGLYGWGFFFASLVPAVIVPLMAGVAALAWTRTGASSPGDVRPSGPGVVSGARVGIAAGLVLTAAYAPLSAAAYASQYTVFEWLLRRDLAAASLWYFNNPDGAPLTFDLLAYAIWGTGALMIVWPLLDARGATAVVAWSLAASGGLSIVAFALHALESDVAGALSTVSGALVVPAAVAALVVVRRDTEGGAIAP